MLCALKNPAIARSFYVVHLKHAASFRIFVLCTLKNPAIARSFYAVHLNMRQVSGFLCSVHLEVLQFQRFQDGFFDLQAGMAVFFGRCCWGLWARPIQKGFCSWGPSGNGTKHKHGLTREEGEPRGRDRDRYRYRN